MATVHPIPGWHPLLADYIRHSGIVQEALWSHGTRGTSQFKTWPIKTRAASLEDIAGDVFK